jgi:ADP-ribose pyrophosphatase YjhB (NUDIX family)
MPILNAGMPRPSVFACFLCPVTGEILLVHQRSGKWSLPGGRCYASEKPMTALRREVREETTFVLPADAQPEQAWAIRRRWRKRGRDAVVFLFRHRPDVMASAEIDAVRWFPLAALPTGISRTAIATVQQCARLPEVLAEQVA